MAHRSIHILVALSLTVAVAAEVPQLTAVEIGARDGKITARLGMPKGTTGRVPVVLFVSGAEEVTAGGVRSFSNALAADGIASLRYERRAPAVVKEGDAGFESEVADAAAMVSFLRNDIRFSTITIADETGSSIGAIAARVARADTSVAFSLADPPTVTKAVRDLDLPGAPRPRRNTGQRASLRDTTIATIDGARIAIEYGRPSKRGRVIWGNLVKWGGWWMPGADEASTLTTNRNLTFGSLTVPAGDYTLYTQPGEAEFMLIVNRQTGQFHTVYNPDQDFGRVVMTKEAVDPIAERLTFAIEPRAGGGGSLKLIWDDRAYMVPFTVSGGTEPGTRTRAIHRAEEAARLRQHFDTVDMELRARDTSSLSGAQRARRTAMIQWLRDYRNAGRFPENRQYSRRVPIFRDDAGTLCAMAYLIARSGETGFVDEVSATRNTAYMSELADNPQLVSWLDDAGLTVDEAARIQPSYPCGFGPCETRVLEETKVTPAFGAATVATAGLSVTTLVRSVTSPTSERGWQAVFAGGVETLLGLSQVGRGGATRRLAWTNIAVGGVALSAGIRAIRRASGGPAAQPRPGVSRTIDVSLYSPMEPGDRGRRFGAQVHLTFR